MSIEVRLSTTVSSGRARLTEREREVLVLVARYLSNEEIARQLRISRGSVRMYLYQIYLKLEAQNRMQAVQTAFKEGIIQPRDVFSREEWEKFFVALGLEELETIAQVLKQRIGRTQLHSSTVQWPPGGLTPVTLRREKLTRREQEVLASVCRGSSNKEIAEQLFISTYAVRIYLHRIYLKLGVQNRMQAVQTALKEGALPLQDIYSPEELADFLAALGPKRMETIAQLVRQRLGQSELTSIGS